MHLLFALGLREPKSSSNFNVDRWLFHQALPPLPLSLPLSLSLFLPPFLCPPFRTFFPFLSPSLPLSLSLSLSLTLAFLSLSLSLSLSQFLSLPSSFSSASFNRPPFYLISFELYKYKYVLPPFFPRGNCFTVAFFHDGDDDEVLFVCFIFPSFVVAAPERISRGKYSPTFLWQLFRLAGWNGSGNAAPANPHLSKALHRAATLPRRGNVTTRRVSKMKIIINRNKLQINIKARSHQSNDFQKKMMN